MDDVADHYGRRARWWLAHPAAAASITGAAFGILFGGGIVVMALATGESLSPGLLVGGVLVGALAGAPFGILFVKEMRPFFEAMQSGTATPSELATSQWGRDHERVRRHRGFWFWLPLCGFAVAFANAIESALVAGTPAGAVLWWVVAMVIALMSVYLIAVWYSPVPPWSGR